MRDTEWFADHGWGVFCHYLTSPQTTADEWNRRVDAFNVAGLARQLASVNTRISLLRSVRAQALLCAQ